MSLKGFWIQRKEKTWDQSFNWGKKGCTTDNFYKISRMQQNLHEVAQIFFSPQKYLIISSGYTLNSKQQPKNEHIDVKLRTNVRAPVNVLTVLS